MEQTLGILNGTYYGIAGQAHARKNAIAVLECHNPKFYQGRQTFAFEPRGDEVLVTGMWDNAVAFCTLMSKEKARKQWRWVMSKTAYRVK